MLVTWLVKFRIKDRKTAQLELLLQVLPVRIIAFVETLASHLKLKIFLSPDNMFLFPCAAGIVFSVRFCRQSSNSFQYKLLFMRRLSRFKPALQQSFCESLRWLLLRLLHVYECHRGDLWNTLYNDHKELLYISVPMQFELCLWSSQQLLGCLQWNPARMFSELLLWWSV